MEKREIDTFDYAAVAPMLLNFLEAHGITAVLYEEFHSAAGEAKEIGNLTRFIPQLITDTQDGHNRSWEIRVPSLHFKFSISDDIIYLEHPKELDITALEAIEENE